MGFFYFMFFTTLSVIAMICCVRALRIVIKMVNVLFDKLENKYVYGEYRKDS